MLYSPNGAYIFVGTWSHIERSALALMFPLLTEGGIFGHIPGVEKEGCNFSLRRLDLQASPKITAQFFTSAP